MQQRSPFQEPLFRSIVLGGSILLVLAAVLMHLQSVLHACGVLLRTLRPLLLCVLVAPMLAGAALRM